MEILGKAISDKTAAVIADLEHKLNKPVVYHFTDPDKNKGFGDCDCSQEDAVHIYSKEALFNLTKAKAINPAFETNILHQLLLACQTSEGFPQVETKDTEITQSAKEFYDSLGKFFGSSVLSLNVDARLKELGYASDYFHKHSINQADKMTRRGFQVTNEIDFSRFACQLMVLKLCCPGKEMDALLELLHEKNAAMVTLINRIADQISKQGYQTAEEVLACLVLIFSTFNLWFTHNILFNGKVYSSPEEIQEAFPDMKFPGLN